MASCANQTKTQNKCVKKKPKYDFIIAGTGPGGSVAAFRTSENVTQKVLVIDAGRDSAKLPELLPEPSDANVAQPGSFHWGVYVRAVNLAQILASRGFVTEYYFGKQSSNQSSRSISYPRVFDWGGACQINTAIAIRNAPYNWDGWGLPQWTFNMVQPYFFPVENRSQQTASGALYYDPAKPVGTLGSFSNQYYGENGMVPLDWTIGSLSSPFLTAVNIAVTTQLNTHGFTYPLNVDLDYPPNAAQGGTSFRNSTQIDQTGSIILPNTNSRVPAASYNQILYGDNGFVYPPELAPFGLTGLAPQERASPTTSYLYPAIQNHSNLTILSDCFVRRLIIKKKKRSGLLKVVGLQYYEDAYNIFEAGRNDSYERAGYGGSRGDARANFKRIKKRNLRTVYAKKEVILAAGFLMTPQILFLSGIGDKNALASLGIKCVLNLPGVGQNFVDNQELLIFWGAGTNINSATIPQVTLAAKSTPSQPVPNFDTTFGPISIQSLEASDLTVQRGYVGTKNLGGLDNLFVRNNPSNILLDPQKSGNPQTNFVPIYWAPTNRLGGIVEMEENNRSRGFLQFRSKNPTVPPLFVTQYLSNSQDLQDWVDLFMNNYFPVMLALGFTTRSTVTANPPVGGQITGLTSTPGSGYTVLPVITITNAPGDPGTGFAVQATIVAGGVNYTITNNGTGYITAPTITVGSYFETLLDPAPYDILMDGVTNFTNISQVSIPKLQNYLLSRIGGHHGYSTCMMSTSLNDNPNAVVDQNGIVFGFSNLRLCDTSIIPISIRWPNITMYVIAEKLMANLKQKWNL